MRQRYVVFEKILKSIDKRFVSEYKFYDKRKWRFDFALPELKIAVEIEGGLWIYGRHNRALGYTKDLEKYNTATCMGWSIIRVPSSELHKSCVFDCIEKLIKYKENGEQKTDS